MYPSTLIRLNRKNTVYVELKNSTKVTGFMLNCDVAMNMHIKNAEIEDRSGKTKVSEMYLRGQSIKLVKLHTWVMSKQEMFV
ncbi:LSM4 [Enterospora canceri]|uniref:LSM4 n=1 Tax=Enterospora canceri TaxID=1081671 RepID=A0A1Y1S6D5_9MICR|nr:LSM4 [Enterospora canceri]